MATKTIYVELLAETVDVWRPVEATVEAGGTFRLPDQGSQRRGVEIPAREPRAM